MPVVRDHKNKKRKTKRCTRCFSRRNIKFFTRDGSTKDGKNRLCIDCLREANGFTRFHAREDDIYDKVYCKACDKWRFSVYFEHRIQGQPDYKTCDKCRIIRHRKRTKKQGAIDKIKNADKRLKLNKVGWNLIKNYVEANYRDKLKHNLVVDILVSELWKKLGLKRHEPTRFIKWAVEEGLCTATRWNSPMGSCWEFRVIK